MGSTSSVSVSIPDSSATCANLGLPTLPSGYTYRCVTSANVKKVDGAGWVPVNFTQISSGSPLGTLPVDPVNSTSTGTYYTYVTGGSWELTAIPESSKYRAVYSKTPIPQPGVIAVGSNLSLSPIFDTSELVGYWAFDDGSGTSAADSSGNANAGAWNGSGSHWATGKVGGAGQFNGTNDYVNIGDPPALRFNGATQLTVAAWVKRSSSEDVGGIVGNWTSLGSDGHLMYTSSNKVECVVKNTSETEFYASGGGVALPADVWTHVACDLDGSRIRIFFNGIEQASTVFTGTLKYTGQPVLIGLYSAANYFTGEIDDLRIYSRALSAAEILAIYNATK
jgi:hypothetical protein